MAQTKTPERTIPLAEIFQDPRLVPVGTPDKSDKTPLGLRGVDGQPFIEADRAYWRRFPGDPNAMVVFILARRNEPCRDDSTLTTIFTPTRIMQTFETKLHDVTGELSAETTATMDARNPESQFGLRHRLSKGILRQRSDILEGIYDGAGNLTKIDILEARFLLVKIGTIKFDSNKPETPLIVFTYAEEYNPKREPVKYPVAETTGSSSSLNSYTDEGIVTEKEIIIPFVRLRDHTGIEKCAHFPKRRYWDREETNARVNRPLLDSLPKWNKPYFFKFD